MAFLSDWFRAEFYHILRNNLGFSPSTGMSYGIDLSQEKFEWSVYDKGDETKAVRQKKISRQVASLRISYNW